MRDLEFDIKGRDKSGPAFNSARANARSFNGELDVTARGFEMAGNAAKLFVAGFTLSAIAEFGSRVRGVITEAADLVDLADKVGVATGDLQRMQFGFEQAGVAASDLDQVLTQWSKRIGEAFTNGGRLADILKANNVSLTDGEGHLRSSVDLMRDYAELIANAGSEQEQTTLATEAFGKAGAAMVLALRDGSAGMDELMRAADDAGGVMEDSILRQAAEIDDAFNSMWRTFELGAKQATLSAVSWLAEVTAYAQRFNASLLASTTYGANPPPAEEPRKGDRLKSPIDQRIDAAFGNFGDSTDADKELQLEIRRRYGRRTLIPGKGEGGFDNDNRSRGASTKAAKEQESAYDRVIEKLEEEKAVLGLTDIARRIAVEQQRAGVEATSAEGIAIADLVSHIERQKEAYEAAAEAGDFMKDNLRESFSDILPQIETGNKALDGFINRLAQAAMDAAFFGEGPLSGLFGGGGLFKSLFGGGRSVGGGVDPWNDYLVGENGPEIVRIGAKGGVVGGVSEGGGGGFYYAPVTNINAPNSDQAAIARLERTIARQNRTESKRVAGLMHTQQVRGTRP